MSILRFKTFVGATTCALLLISPFIFSRSLLDYANLPQTVFIQAVSLFLLVTAAIRAAAKGRVTFSKNPLSYAVAFFLLWALSSLNWAGNRYEGLVVFFHLMSCGAIFFVISSFRDDDRWLERLLLAIAWAGFGIALLGCIQHAFKCSWIPQQVPPAATFGNKNVGAQVVGLILPVLPVIAFLPAKDRATRATRVAVPFIAVIFFAYLFFTETRSAWLAAVVSLCFVTVKLLRDSRRPDSSVKISRRVVFPLALASLLVSAGLILFTPKPFQDLVNVSKQKFFSRLNDRGTLDIRLIMWRNGLEMFKDRPISGYGIGNFKVYYPAYHRKVLTDPVFSERHQPLNIHNDFVQTGIELGIGGGLLFVGLFGLSLFMAFKLSSAKHPPRIRLIGTGLGGGVMAMVVIAVFSFPLERAVPSLIFFSYMGILTACHDGHILESRTRVLGFPAKAAIPACVSILAVTVLNARFNYANVVSDAHFRSTLEMACMGALPETVDAGLKAYRVNPGKKSALEAVGWAYVEMDEIDKGIESLETVLQAYPYNIKAKRELGEAYYEVGDVKKALETFEKLIEIKPDYPAVLALMGNIHMRDKDYGSALKYFEQATAYDRDNFLFHANLGFLRFKMGRFSEAAHSYETVLKYRPDMLYAHMSLASIYDRLGGQQRKALYHRRRITEIRTGDVWSGEPEKKIFQP